MVPADALLLEVSWDNDIIVDCVNNDIANCLWANSVSVGWVVDIILDPVITILFRFDERHCKWEVIVVITIKFVDGVDFMDDSFGELSSISSWLSPLAPVLSSPARCSKIAQ